MTNFSQLLLAADAARADPLRLAAAAYLARFTGLCDMHTGSDLRAHLAWCAERRLDPLGRRSSTGRAVHPLEAGVRRPEC